MTWFNSGSQRSRSQQADEFKSCEYHTRDVESSFFGGILTPTSTPALRLWLRVKVGHWLLNLCDCDNVLNERCRQIPQIVTNNRLCILGLVCYALSVIWLYSVRLWKQVRPMRSPFLQDSDSGIKKKLGLRLQPWARIQTQGTPNPHPWWTPYPGRLMIAWKSIAGLKSIGDSDTDTEI